MNVQLSFLLSINDLAFDITGFDKRLALFLLEESALEGSACLKMTHERIANHLGTAREVVTRMLRYFQSEGMVRLSRGEIAITDEKALRKLVES